MEPARDKVGISGDADQQHGKGSRPRSLASIGKNVIKQEAKGLQALSEKIDRHFEEAVGLLNVPGMVIFTGVGKSGHVGKKLAATFVSLGIRSTFIHPTEAAHGDLGLLRPGDAIVALSRSGKAIELISILSRKSQCPVVLISENDKESLAAFADVVLKLPKVAEAWGHAPTTSTVMQMAMGDALAIALTSVNGFTEEDFKATHPGGVLGHGKG